MNIDLVAQAISADLHVYLNPGVAWSDEQGYFFWAHYRMPVRASIGGWSGPALDFGCICDTSSAQEAASCSGAITWQSPTYLAGTGTLVLAPILHQWQRF